MILSAIFVLLVALFVLLDRFQQYLRTSEILRAPAQVSSDGLRPAQHSKPSGAGTAHERSSLCNSFYGTICKKSGESRDPTGIVRPDIEGEIEALRIYEEIIRQHRDWTSDQVDEELVKVIYTPERRGRIESAFRWVRQTLERVIDRERRTVFTAQEKTMLKQRIRGTRLELPPPAALYADEPDIFTKNEVFYERTMDGQTRMRVGGAYLFTSKSWFNVIFTLAHEFGHAIDPCELRSAGLSFPAYDRLTACFLQFGWVPLHKDRSTECGENDQLSEIFADWLAVRVTAAALKTFATEFHATQLVGAAVNAVRDLCEQDDPQLEVDLTNHPAPQFRIESIFGRNPKVREILGCGPAPGSEYCSFEFQPPVLDQAEPFAQSQTRF